MPPKSKLAGTVLTPERHAQLKAAAAAQGLTVSSFLGRLIDIVLEEGEAPAPEALPSKSRREGKVTARLPRGVREKLEEEAKARGVTVSTWVGSMLRARYRKAPQPLPPDRRKLMRAFRKLNGIAVNANQMAFALNKAVLTSGAIEVTAEEVRALTVGVSGLSQDLRRLARGGYIFESLTMEGDDE